MRVVIIGGGITGLATAYALSRLPDVHITLLEANARWGGNILTDRVDDFVLDAGPDSWVVTKPHATALAKRLGLEAELVPTREENRKVYIAHEGELHPLPEGLVLGVPTRLRPVLQSRLFSARGKVRMALEPFVPRRASDDDESIYDFVVRRLGREAAERVAAPLLGGVFAGDARALSMAATFPQFIAMERDHGSLALALRKARRTPQGEKSAGAFVSLRGGMDTLVRTLVDSLRHVRVRTSAIVRSIERVPTTFDSPYVVILEGGESVEADQVVVAVPPYRASAILKSFDDTLATELEGIECASTATVFLAFRREQIKHPLDGVGFIVPRSSGHRCLAGTWVSSKWPSRAPDDSVLFRVFFGGAEDSLVLDRDDADLVRLAKKELFDLMALDATERFFRVYRFHRASPQPKVGHIARMERVRIRVATHPGLHVGGNGYFGIGIPDCIKQAEHVAALIAAASVEPQSR